MYFENAARRLEAFLIDDSPPHQANHGCCLLNQAQSADRLLMLRQTGLHLNINAVAIRADNEYRLVPNENGFSHLPKSVRLLREHRPHTPHLPSCPNSQTKCLKVGQKIRADNIPRLRQIAHCSPPYIPLPLDNRCRFLHENGRGKLFAFLHRWETHGQATNEFHSRA